MLERHRLAAHRRAGAHLRRQIERLRHRGLEHVDVQAAEVLRQPFAPQRAQEFAVVARIHRPLGDDSQGMAGAAARRTQQWHVGAARQAGCAQLEVARFHARRELDAKAARDGTQAAIHLERGARHVAIDHAQQGERHFGCGQPGGGGEGAVEAGLAALGGAVAVVQFARAVHAETDHEAVCLEEGHPLIVEQQTIGLQVVLDALARFAMTRLELDHAAKEAQPHHRRFAPLPGEDDLVAGLGFDVLADVGLEQAVVDARVALVRQQIGLVQVKAVGAVQIAQRAGGLDHDVVAVMTARGQRWQAATRCAVQVLGVDGRRAHVSFVSSLALVLGARSVPKR